MLVQQRSSPANSNPRSTVSTNAYDSEPTSAMTTSRRQPSIEGISVICLYDYESNDNDHISFRKDDILTVIHQEPSGWWAAQVNGRIGWIPSAYVKPITAAERLALQGGYGVQDNRPSTDHRGSGGHSGKHRAIGTPRDLHPSIIRVPIIGHRRLYST